MKTVIFVSHEVPQEMVCKINTLCDRVVLLPPSKQLSASCASHADLLIAPLSDGLLIHSDYYNNNRTLFTGVNVILTNEPMAAVYPSDILFDALVIDNTVYGKIEYVSDYIKSGKRTVSVKQGYTRCSTLALPNRYAAITADRGIAAVLKADGFDVLQISGGGISLPGLGEGFIGGASGVIGDSVLFFGNPDTHPDGAAILSFLDKYGMKAVSLGTGILTDFGGIVTVKFNLL